MVNLWEPGFLDIINCQLVLYKMDNIIRLEILHNCITKHRQSLKKIILSEFLKGLGFKERGGEHVLEHHKLFMYVHMCNCYIAMQIILCTYSIKFHFVVCSYHLQLIVIMWPDLGKQVQINVLLGEDKIYKGQSYKHEIYDRHPITDLCCLVFITLVATPKPSLRKHVI